MQGRDKQAERKNIVYWGRWGQGWPHRMTKSIILCPGVLKLCAFLTVAGREGRGDGAVALGIHRTSILEVGFQSKISTDNYGGKGHPNQGVGLDMHPN